MPLLRKENVRDRILRENKDRAKKQAQEERAAKKIEAENKKKALTEQKEREVILNVIVDIAIDTKFMKAIYEDVIYFDPLGIPRCGLKLLEGQINDEFAVLAIDVLPDETKVSLRLSNSTVLSWQVDLIENAYFEHARLLPIMHEENLIDYLIPSLVGTVTAKSLRKKYR